MTATLSAVSGACGDVREATDADAVCGVPAGLVARPSSTEEVRELLRAAAGHRLTVVPRGAGTKLGWGNPPTTVDLVVDLTRMDAVLDHAAGDLIAVAQPGCPLSAVQRALAPAGQRLAVDETAPGATVGGTVAANASGPQRMLHGTMRDLLIGITIVRADGVRAKSGGRVVKNVAGYDLGKLLTGSFGTLGVITEVIFRLHPLPAATNVLTVQVSQPAEAARLATAAVHSTVVPSAVEIDWPPTGPVRFAVLLEGIEAGVRGRAARTRELLASAGADEVELADERPSWWGRYPWGVDAVGLKLTCALSGIRRLLDAVAQLRAGRGPALHLRGSAGAGVFYAGLPADAGAGNVRETVRQLRPLCAELGGSLVVLDAPPALKTGLDLWGPVPALELMRAVKDQFDPEHRLSPGRFVGGI